MPVLTRSIPELVDHIFMPVCQQVSHRILHMLEYEDVVGDQIYINTDWSTHSVTHDKNDNANIGQTRFSMDVNIQLNPTSQKWDVYTFHHTTAYGFGTVLRDRQEPIYYDAPNNIKIVQMVSPVTMMMNCELFLASAELAFQTPAQIFNGYETGSIHTYTDLFYDYPVPKPILSVLYGIWSMDRVQGKSAGIPFVQYIKSHTNNTWNIHKHREKDEFEIVVPAYDLKVLNVLEYSDDKPQGIMEDKIPVGYSIPFVFTIQFNIPTLMIMDYPCVINNQLVPDRYISRDTNIRFNAMPESRHGTAYGPYENSVKYPLVKYWRVPWYDDWYLPGNTTMHTKHQYQSIVMHLLIDEDKPQFATTIDLLEDYDPSYKLADTTHAILKLLGSNCTDPHAPMCVWLFRDNTELKPNEDFYVDDNCVLYFKATDLQYHYRIAISTVTDIYWVSPKYFNILLKYMQYLPTFLVEQIIARLTGGDWSECFRNFIKSKTNQTTYSNKVNIYRDGSVVLNPYNKVIGNVSDIDIDKLYASTTDDRSLQLDTQPIYVTVFIDENTRDVYYPGMVIPDTANTVKKVLSIMDSKLLRYSNSSNRIFRDSIIGNIGG